MIAQTTTGKAYCNCLAMESGLRPSGHAGDFQDAFILEAPLPWKLDMMQKAGALPQTVIGGLSGELYEGVGPVTYFSIVSALTLPAVVLARLVPPERLTPAQPGSG